MPRYLPRKNALHLCVFIYDGEGNASFQNGDIIEEDDFEFCKERIDGERERLLVDSVLVHVQVGRAHTSGVTAPMQHMFDTTGKLPLCR